MTGGVKEGLSSVETSVKSDQNKLTHDTNTAPLSYLFLPQYTTQL